MSEVDPFEPEASVQSKVKLSPMFEQVFQDHHMKPGSDWTPLDIYHGSDDVQRVLDIGEGCSSSDESYVGQSNVIASSSSDEDHHPVVSALL